MAKVAWNHRHQVVEGGPTVAHSHEVEERLLVNKTKNFADTHMEKYHEVDSPAAKSEEFEGSANDNAKSSE